MANEASHLVGFTPYDAEVIVDLIEVRLARLAVVDREEVLVREALVRTRDALSPIARLRRAHGLQGGAV
jgi:hypothetical protein